jgi:hypothetical protein
MEEKSAEIYRAQVRKDFGHRIEVTPEVIVEVVKDSRWGVALRWHILDRGLWLERKTSALPENEIREEIISYLPLDLGGGRR